MPVVEASRRERKVIRFLRAMAKMEDPDFETETEVATVAVSALQWSQSNAFCSPLGGLFCAKKTQSWIGSFGCREQTLGR